MLHLASLVRQKSEGWNGQEWNSLQCSILNMILHIACSRKTCSWVKWYLGAKHGPVTMPCECLTNLNVRPMAKMLVMPLVCQLIALLPTISVTKLSCVKHCTVDTKVDLAPLGLLYSSFFKFSFCLVLALQFENAPAEIDFLYLRWHVVQPKAHNKLSTMCNIQWDWDKINPGNQVLLSC